MCFSIGFIYLGPWALTVGVMCWDGTLNQNMPDTKAPRGERSNEVRVVVLMPVGDVKLGCRRNRKRMRMRDGEGRG